MKMRLSFKKFVAGLGLILAVMAMTMVLGITTAAAGKACATIQGGSVVDSAGNPVTVGYDAYGYNYQAHSYNGTYDGLDRVLDGKYYGQSGSWVNDSVQMKWSDDWLSNTDCNGDGRFDRGTAGVSLGWLTNHLRGNGYTEFDKIVYTGPGGDTWGVYTTIQSILTGVGGYHYKSGIPGLGLNDGWTVVG